MGVNGTGNIVPYILIGLSASLRTEGKPRSTKVGLVVTSHETSVSSSES